MNESIRGERVLVTGGAGFVGSSLVGHLLDCQNDVVVLDNFLSGTSEQIKDASAHLSLTDETIDRRLTVVEGDIRSADIVDILQSNDIDYVFNLAARPFVTSGYEDPGEFLSVNAMGALNVFLACLEADVTRVLHYSTSEVYGTSQSDFMDETHPLNPQSTYSVTKLAADRLSYTLYHEQRLPVVVLRQFNTYGPRETHPYIVPEIISQLSDSPRLELGNVHSCRDLTYVDDAVRGASKLINCPEAVGEVVNLGYGSSISIEGLASLIGNLMGYDEIDLQIDEGRLRPHDVERLRCDFTKATDLIDYQPTVSLEEGLTRTVEWYQKKGGWSWERQSTHQAMAENE